MNKYNVNINSLLISKLDEILPRLKYSVNYKKIIKWLHNFEELDQRNALEVLFYLEYLDINEITFRLNEKLNIVIESIPTDYKIIIFPAAGDYPKSPELINYILKETPAVKKLFEEDRLLITRELKDIKDLSSPTIFILTDDFVGSGKSFRKAYDSKTGLKGWIDLNPFIKDVFLIATIIMSGGINYINKRYPEVFVYADVRNKVFDSEFSPLKLYSKNIDAFKNLAEKYGKNLYGDTNKLGFKNSQSLVAFNHTSPNNTLPIIWSGKNWNPIFPRFGENKLKMAKDLKREVAYYIGVMNRLGLDLYQDKTIYLNGKREVKYNSIEDHSLITLIKLHIDGYEKPTICQILGITLKEHNEIIEIGKERSFFDQRDNLTNNGRAYYTQLIKKIGPQDLRFLKRDKENFMINNINYIPKKFKGNE